MGKAAFRTVSPSDRRNAERLATSLRGKVFPGEVDCVIADFTKVGAKLKFNAPPPADGRLIMVVWSSGVAFDAQVRWRHGLEIGVQFQSSRDLRRPAPPHLVEIQALWAKRRPRLGRRQFIASPVILQKRPRAPRQPVPYRGGA